MMDVRTACLVLITQHSGGSVMLARSMPMLSVGMVDVRTACLVLITQHSGGSVMLARSMPMLSVGMMDVKTMYMSGVVHMTFWWLRGGSEAMYHRGTTEAPTSPIPSFYVRIDSRKYEVTIRLKKI